VSEVRSGERANQQFQDVLRATVCLSASVPALGRTRHPFAVSGLEGPSPKIEFGFSASPETIRREPREGDLLCSVGNMQDLAVCAFCSSCFLRQYFMLPLFCVLPQARSLSVADPRQANTRRSSALRQVSPDCYFLFAFPGHKSQLTHGSVSTPASQPLSKHAGYVYCATFDSGIRIALSAVQSEHYPPRRG
jgi:hypothetical protein